MASKITVWCLLIDHTGKLSFGEPFPVYLGVDDTIHDFKEKIKMGWFSTELSHITPNKIKVLKCKSKKLSATDPIDEKQLGFKLFRDIQQLGPAQKVTALALEDSEVLLAVVPRNA